MFGKERERGRVDGEDFLMRLTRLTLKFKNWKKMRENEEISEMGKKETENRKWSKCVDFSVIDQKRTRRMKG